MSTYYRIHPANESPDSILDESRWHTGCWDERYIRCGACNGSGVEYANDLDDDGQLILTEERCPVCGGEGEIADIRYGVSCCASLDDLRRYAQEHGMLLDGDTLIELEGELSDDDDHDAADGAILVLPSRIVSTTTITADWAA